MSRRKLKDTISGAEVDEDKMVHVRALITIGGRVIDLRGSVSDASLAAESLDRKKVDAPQPVSRRMSARETREIMKFEPQFDPQA